MKNMRTYILTSPYVTEKYKLYKDGNIYFVLGRNTPYLPLTTEHFCRGYP
jgi:hypothetical protein